MGLYHQEKITMLSSSKDNKFVLYIVTYTLRCITFSADN
jgi:hypothetical protein